MLKIFLILSILFSIHCYADPFYGQDNQTEIIKEEKNISGYQKCTIPTEVFPLPFPEKFNDVSFVGVFINNNKAKALFINNKNKIIDVKVNDIFSSDQI